MPEPRSAHGPSPSFVADRDGIGWITFDDPERPVNVLTEPVMKRLGEALDDARAAAREERIGAVVVRSAKPGSFVVGADVDAIAALEDPSEAEAKIRLGQAVLNDLVALPVPTIAAVHGACLGGGLEIALACEYRVLSSAKSTGLQFPEVMLGLLPAWGGTTRLPRLVGLRAALDMLLAGRRIDARAAERMGLATARVPAELLDAQVRDLARELAYAGARPPRPRRTLRRLLEDSLPGRRILLALARRRVLATTGGHYPAPLRILDILREHFGGGVEASLAAEARAAAELIVGPVCKNLLHVYYLREAARKGTGTADESVAPAPVRRMGVLGAGVMGGGIAHLAATNDIPVYMKDVRHEAVTGGLRHARRRLDHAVRRRRLNAREAAQRMDLISGGLDYHGLASADLVVEAVVERMDVKRQVLRETERHVRPDCVIATNTSSLSVDGMAEALELPGRFCGMHFFNPVERMPLVEVVRGAATSEQTVATVYACALRLGKVPVVVSDGPGFLVNRILGPYLNEAGHLLGEGATIERIDAVAKAFGMPMGPLRLIDEIGIDVATHAGRALHRALGERMAPAPALVALAETGRLGRKGGSGFYLYQGERERGVDRSVYAALGSAVAPPRPMDEQDVLMRLLLPMIAEAARALDERIVTRAADVDLAMIMGTGFPPFRGGLLVFADSLHPKALLEHARALEAAHGERFAPPRLLVELAERDRCFYEAFPGGAA